MINLYLIKQQNYIMMIKISNNNNKFNRLHIQIKILFMILNHQINKITIVNQV